MVRLKRKITLKGVGQGSLAEFLQLLCGCLVFWVSEGDLIPQPCSADVKLLLTSIRDANHGENTALNSNICFCVPCLSAQQQAEALPVITHVLHDSQFQKPAAPLESGKVSALQG